MIGKKKLKRVYTEAKKRARLVREALCSSEAQPRSETSRCELLLLDFSRNDDSLKSLRAGIESEVRRLGITMRMTDQVLQPDPGDEPLCVVCLGQTPPDFNKPGLAQMVQILSHAPTDPWSQLVTSRDSNLLLCVDSRTFDELSERLPRKEVRNHAPGGDRIVEALGEYFRSIGLVAGVRPEPIRSFRRAGPRLIDVYMTTSQRPEFFEKTFLSLLRASQISHHRVRLNVFVDQMDEGTLLALKPHLSKVNLLSTSFQLGLPFLYNMILEHQAMVDARSEEFADYLCYIQDDCLIANAEIYFDFMVGAYEELMPVNEVGYVSGFYCSIHPGFEVVDYKRKKLLLSDSIDGKNFMAPPALLREVGPLSWHFNDGERRGNPGPRRGSHFDLWQWKESPRALMKQGRVSVVVPGLCVHLAQSAEESTWGNETSQEKQLKRREEGRIYNTRGIIPPVIDNQF